MRHHLVQRLAEARKPDSDDAAVQARAGPWLFPGLGCGLAARAGNGRAVRRPVEGAHGDIKAVEAMSIPTTETIAIVRREPAPTQAGFTSPATR